MKREMQQRGITVEMWQELNARVAILTAIIKEQQATEKNIQQTLKKAQDTFTAGGVRLFRLFLTLFSHV